MKKFQLDCNSHKSINFTPFKYYSTSCDERNNKINFFRLQRNKKKVSILFHHNKSKQIKIEYNL